MKTLYDCNFVAERYGVTLRTVWRWIREKKLPALKVGKEYRVTEEDIHSFESNQRANKEG